MVQPQIPLSVVLLAAGCISVAYGFCVGISQGCLRIGREISETNSKTGLQDAVSPPILAKAMMTLTTVFVVVLAYTFWRFGVLVGLAEVVGAFLIFGLGSYLAPRATSPYYAKLTFRSLARRAANYARDNDHMRSDAALWMAKRIEQLHAEELVK